MPSINKNAVKTEKTPVKKSNAGLKALNMQGTKATASNIWDQIFVYNHEMNTKIFNLNA